MFGVVIAGGRSRRFGSEKAVAVINGRPLLLWAVQRLARSCSQVAVNARPGTAAEALARQHGLHVVTDLPGDPDGPLAGVRAALSWTARLGGSTLAVSPCDTPGLPEDLYERLGEAAGASGAALAETSNGRQPMCAVWPVSALPRLAAALEHGQHPPVWRILDELGAARVHFDPPEAFANINTVEDLARLQARLAARGEP